MSPLVPRRWTSALVVAALAVTVLAPTAATAQTAPQVLQVQTVAYAQGDATLVSTPCRERFLIDAGTGSREEVQELITASGYAGLQAAFVTHYDDDHLGDVVDLARAHGTLEVFDRGGDRTAKDTAAYREYYDHTTSVGSRRSVDIGFTRTFCSGSAQPVTVTVVSAGTDGTAVGGVTVTEEDDRGLCLLVEHGDFDYAHCGDISGTDEGSRTDVESPAAAVLGDVDAAHVNHHGSASSSNDTWVSTLRAQAAFVSVGANSYGHPDPVVLDRWRAAGTTLWQTLDGDGRLAQGTISLRTTGTHSFTVSHFGATQALALDDAAQPEPAPEPEPEPVVLLPVVEEQGPVVRGSRVVLRGTARAGQAVELLARRQGASASTSVRQLVADDDGRWTTSYVAAVDHEFHARTSDGTGSTVRVAAVGTSLRAPAVVPRGTTVTVTGTGRPGSALDVRFRAAGTTSWSVRRRATPDADGRWSTSWTADRDYAVYASTAEARSATSVVKAAFSTISGPARAAKGATVTLAGTARPGSRVGVFLRRAGTSSYRQVRALTAAANGTWRTTYVADAGYAYVARADGVTSAVRSTALTASRPAAAPRPAPAPAAPARPADRDCGDFSTQAQAQAFHDRYFPHYGDVARLDGDGDGRACDALP